MAEEIVVEARPGVAPVEQVTETVEETPAGGELSDELLQIPVFQALVAGAPAAVSADLKALEKKPEAKIIASSKDALISAGINLYRTMEGSRGVFFNGLFISPDEVKAADQAGTLLELAPDFDQVNAEVAKSGGANPVLTAGERPSGFKTNSGPMPTGASAGQTGPMPAPPSSSSQKTVANQRTKNLQPGAPTSGQAGAGRLLNSILKPVL